MKLNRSLPPVIKTLEKVAFLKAKTHLCSNNVPIHYINHGEQEVVRLQFVYDAGTYYQNMPLLASIVNSLLVEGTAHHSSLEIANYFENRGAFLNTEIDADTASLTLYCLTKNVEELLPYISEIISSANFPQEEIDNYLSIQAQNFAVNSQKVSFQAKNNFLTSIFGEQNRYANKIEAKHFEAVKREELLAFYKKFYQNVPFSIYAAGKVDEAIVQKLEMQFGKEPKTAADLALLKNSDSSSYAAKTQRIPVQNALQSAIRIGKPIIAKTHSDFPALFFANAVLGGYFGSRLMSNIREDKGYTYGIGSGLVSYKHAAYFVISTEVGAEVTEATMREIEFEVKRLQNEPIDDLELQLVKNYLHGSILKNFDGAFAAMDRFRSITELGLDYKYYDNLIEKISAMDAQRVQEIAIKYLTFESFNEIIAGKV